MEDQAGLDEKIVAVPVDALHPFYTDIGSYLELPKILLDQIAHFFHHYKDLETRQMDAHRQMGGRSGIRASDHGSH